MLEMILKGGWKTPDHPETKRQKDDMHEVKNRILSSLSSVDYVEEVGRNPNIAVNKNTKNIILEGVGVFKNKSYTTELSAKDFFVKIQFAINKRTLSRFIINRNTFVLPYDPELIADLIIYQILHGTTNRMNIIIRKSI